MTSNMKGYPDTKYLEWVDHIRQMKSRPRKPNPCPHCGKDISKSKIKYEQTYYEVRQTYWRVRIMNVADVGHIRQRFWVTQYGSKRKAYLAAIEFRNEMLEMFGELHRLEETRGRKPLKERKRS